jgi:hypothetical protein
LLFEVRMTPILDFEASPSLVLFREEHGGKSEA